MDLALHGSGRNWYREASATQKQASLMGHGQSARNARNRCEFVCSKRLCSYIMSPRRDDKEGFKG
jgi:hypothetical protein